MNNRTGEITYPTNNLIELQINIISIEISGICIFETNKLSSRSGIFVKSRINI